MADAATLTFTLDANSARLVSELLKAQRATQDATRRMASSFEGLRNSVRSATNAIVGSVGALAAFLSVRELVRYGEAWSEVQNRLRLVASTTEEVVATQAKLFAISQETRTSFEDTVELYRRVNISSRNLNLTSAEQIDLIKTINQSLQISGATAMEARNGLIQFAQGLASARLAGDELRAVLEQMPRLAMAIADGLGVNIGVLREWGKEGKLTADAVLGAIQSQAATIDKEFKNVIPTLQQTFTQIGNILLTTVGPAVRLLFDQIKNTMTIEGGFGSSIFDTIGAAALAAFTVVYNVVTQTAQAILAVKRAVLEVRLQLEEMAGSDSEFITSREAAERLRSVLSTVTKQYGALNESVREGRSGTAMLAQVSALEGLEMQLDDVVGQVIALGRQVDSSAAPALERLVELRDQLQQKGIKGGFDAAIGELATARDRIGDPFDIARNGLGAMEERLRSASALLKQYEDAAAEAAKAGGDIGEPARQKIAELRAEVENLSNNKIRFEADLTRLSEAKNELGGLSALVTTLRQRQEDLGRALGKAIDTKAPAAQIEGIQKGIQDIAAELADLESRRGVLNEILKGGGEAFTPEQAEMFAAATEEASRMAAAVMEAKEAIAGLGIDPATINSVSDLNKAISSIATKTLDEASIAGKPLLSNVGKLKLAIQQTGAAADELGRSLVSPEELLARIKSLASSYGGISKGLIEQGNFTQEALANARTALPKIMALAEQAAIDKKNFEIAVDTATVEAMKAGRISAQEDLNAIIAEYATRNADRQRQMDELTGRAKVQSEVERLEEINKAGEKAKEQALQREQQLREKIAKEGITPTTIGGGGLEDAEIQAQMSARLAAKQALLTAEGQLEEQAIALGRARIDEQFAYANGLTQEELAAKTQAVAAANAVFLEMARAQAEAEVTAKYEARLAMEEAYGIPTDAETLLAMEQEKQDRYVEIVSSGEARATAAAAQETAKRLANYQKYENARRAMAVSTQNAALGLLQALAGKHKAAAIALIAIEKARAIASVVINTQAAISLAYATFPYPVASGMAASLVAMGAMQVGLIAATGLVEASSVVNPGGGGVASSGGSYSPPSPAMNTFEAQENQKQITVIFQGDVYGWDEYTREKIIGSLKELVDDKDVIIFGGNSRQADIIRGG